VSAALAKLKEGAKAGAAGSAPTGKGYKYHRELSSLLRELLESKKDSQTSPRNKGLG